jgi:Flp pilus assembly protein TadG
MGPTLRLTLPEATAPQRPGAVDGAKIATGGRRCAMIRPDSSRAQGGLSSMPSLHPRPPNYACVRRGSRDGQALVEFALVLPVLLVVLLGLMQFGLIFWAQLTLTQIGRDTGRWAATQTTSPCSAGTAAVQTQATSIAGQSSLYGGSQVTATTTWVLASGTDPCPPPDNKTTWNVHIQLSHAIPIFMPLVSDGTCGSSCRTLTTTVEYRMEPSS